GSWSAQIPATHRQGDAGDVTGLVGSQEQDRAGLLVDAAVALHQRGIDGLVDDLLVPNLLLLALLGRVARNAPRRRLGAARRGGVDANAALGVLEREAGGQRVHAALGRTVGHAVEAAGGDGRDVDDGTTALLQHVRQRGVAAPQRGKQRAAHFSLDFVLLVMLERLGPDGAADVVDQDI